MTTAGPACNVPEAARMHSVDDSLSLGMASSDLGLPLMESGSHATTACWRKALDSIVPACVVLKYVLAVLLKLPFVCCAGHLLERLSVQSHTDSRL